MLSTRPSQINRSQNRNFSRPQSQPPARVEDDISYSRSHVEPAYSSEQSSLPSPTDPPFPNNPIHSPKEQYSNNQIKESERSYPSNQDQSYTSEQAKDLHDQHYSNIQEQDSGHNQSYSSNHPISPQAGDILFSYSPLRNFKGGRNIGGEKGERNCKLAL